MHVSVHAANLTRKLEGKTMGSSLQEAGHHPCYHFFFSQRKKPSAPAHTPKEASSAKEAQLATDSLRGYSSNCVGSTFRHPPQRENQT